ncbi:carbohydrate ABC transporter permease [Lihuaxuella thermophila]|uniref:Multiple sugar transport system permease protein n=1 Tax=Lihuaxuella thermophila TaxID=1173111 RepID=A0A1H8AJ21_9BACL|nr:carbohydrate ABC transporter permease [Lihuaxuella thermophila]SEM70710.1 multiple sugar transport system permease protein [Lihuaxuella thermophila]
MKWIYRFLSICLALIFLVPVIWMLAVSVKVEGFKLDSVFDWFLPPYSLDSYKKVLAQTPLLTWTGNSFIVATATTALVVLLSSMAAFALSVLRFRFKRLVYMIVLAGLMVPGEATIIPLYQVVKDLHLLDSYSGLILPAIASPFAVVVLKSFYDALPGELLESAELDGAGLWTIYSRIVLPLTKPAMSSIAILTFIGSWNSFLWPYLCVSSSELFTLPIGVPTLMSGYTRDYVIPMTVNSLSSIPIILLFLIFEKQIVKGVSLTGLKG